MKSIKLTILGLFITLLASANDHPNIIWLIAEDLSPDLACYGEELVKTPNLDAMSASGMQFENAFASASACSPSRSGFWTGVHQTTLGADFHRTSNPNMKPLPDHIKILTEYLRESGYAIEVGGKKDLNYTFDKSVFKKDKVKEGQPRFIVRQTYHTHRPFHHDTENPIDVNKVKVPSYYPEHPLVRADWKWYLEDVQLMDKWVGEQLAKLEAEGALDNAVVFFFGDHGRPHVRDKQFLYDGGTQVPFIIKSYGQERQTDVTKMTSLLDLAPTALTLAGVETPDHMVGLDIFGDKEHDYLITSRSRHGDAVELMRAIRTKDYLLINNQIPGKPVMQHSSYKKVRYPVYNLLNLMYENDELTAEQKRIFFEAKPEFELYDVNADPENITNIAAVNKKLVKKMNSKLKKWQDECDNSQTDPDQGVLKEKFASKDAWLEGWLKSVNLSESASNEEIVNYWTSQLCPEELKPSATLEGEYKIHWHDEFEGKSLDTDKWAFRTDVKHRSAQLRENVIIKKGCLKLNLRAHETPIKGKKASGAGIISRERFQYGYYEVKSKLGTGTDTDDDGKIDESWHHSFWAMAAVIEGDSVGTTYPGIRRTEIDCYENASEHKGHNSESGLNRFTQHVIVWNEDGKEWGRLPKPPSDVTEIEGFNANEWHTYSFEWTEERINFFVDGELTQVAEYPSNKFVHDHINVWLTAMSANWCKPGAQDSQALYDYFRFFKKVE